jgi:polysaccharide export outer membrane protein
MLPAVLLMLLNSACNSYKNISYFKDVPLSEPANAELVKFTDPKIQPKDIIQVTVQTLDPQAGSMAGTSNTSTFSIQAASSISGGAISVPGFMVDPNGMIELPLVGKIEVAGKTTTEAREIIRQRAAVYYKDPVVNVKLANFNITVLGEVNRPAQYTIPNEKVSILDAIGMAGDLTIFGKRENVMLIREENGEKKFVRFNLNSSNIFQSPYFYLRQGDLVYVEPGKSKAATTDMARARNLTILTSITSLLVITISRLNVFE